jgi:hypothetical protein
MTRGAFMRHKENLPQEYRFQLWEEHRPPAEAEGGAALSSLSCARPPTLFLTEHAPVSDLVQAAALQWPLWGQAPGRISVCEAAPGSPLCVLQGDTQLRALFGLPLALLVEAGPAAEAAGQRPLVIPLNGGAALEEYAPGFLERTAVGNFMKNK